MRLALGRAPPNLVEALGGPDQLSEFNNI